MKLNLIYCKNTQNIIGYDNNLLFTIPEDIKYFKTITSQEYVKGVKNIVIMGYNTWNLYFEYDLDLIYKSEFSLSDGTKLDVRALKVGLIFYLL